MKHICPSFTSSKYRPIGLIWGKHARFINFQLVSYLVSKGLQFYSNVVIPGVENLGLLPRNEWCQLLHDVKFILSFGNPKYGPTILEALNYETVLFGPSEQYPHKNPNIILTHGKTSDEIFDSINTTIWTDYDMSDEYDKRLSSIF